MSTGDNDFRAELAGLAGIPESSLSEALIARLPANEAPAPWECRCSAVMWLDRGGRAAAAALPPALAGSPALATVGGFVHYTDTPVGPYDEVLGMIASRTALRPWGNVAFMSVDSPASLVGGRTNWAMPKSLARFDGEPGADRVISATGDDEFEWSVGASVRTLGPAVPVRMSSTARQQFGDGRIGESALTFRGRARPAAVTVKVSSAGALHYWLRPGRHLGVVVERATFTLGRPSFVDARPTHS